VHHSYNDRTQASMQHKIPHHRNLPISDLPVIVPRPLLPHLCVRVRLRQQRHQPPSQRAPQPPLRAGAARIPQLADRPGGVSACGPLPEEGLGEGP